MNYSEPLSNQVLIFIRGIGFGVILGFIYELFCVLRSLLSDKKLAYVVCDVLFGITAALMSFFFMVLYNDGIVRLNLMASQLIGAVAFHFASGKYLARPLISFSANIRKLIGVIFFPLSFMGKKIKETLLKTALKLKNKIAEEDLSKKDRKKIHNILKIHLKK